MSYCIIGTFDMDNAKWYANSCLPKNEAKNKYPGSLWVAFVVITGWWKPNIVNFWGGGGGELEVEGGL